MKRNKITSSWGDSPGNEGHQSIAQKGKERRTRESQGSKATTMREERENIRRRFKREEVLPGNQWVTGRGAITMSLLSRTKTRKGNADHRGVTTTIVRESGLPQGELGGRPQEVLIDESEVRRRRGITLGISRGLNHYRQ